MLGFAKNLAFHNFSQSPGKLRHYSSFSFDKKEKFLHNVLIKQKVLLCTQLSLLRWSSWEQFIHFFLDTGQGLWQFAHPFMQILFQICNSAIWTSNSFHLSGMLFVKIFNSQILEVFWSLYGFIKVIKRECKVLYI